MNFLYSLALAVTPAPNETLAPGVDEKDVTPGLLGFLFTLFMVIAIVFLIRDMTKRIRRVRYREQLATEQLEREAGIRGDGARVEGMQAGKPEPGAEGRIGGPDTTGKHPR